MTLESLRLEHVGPADRMAIDFTPRMNLLTGDNGLGKSFLLDVAWWTLTRTWARELVVPHRPPAKPQITYAYTARTKAHTYTSAFDRRTEAWSVKQGRPAIPGLVLYAEVDGGFSVWDPARNYWRKDKDRAPAYCFEPAAVWNGNEHCEGLIRDWASWQDKQGEAFQQLTSVLEQLSPSPAERLRPGAQTRISIDDPKDYPTLRMPYGQDVAVVHASAGMRRVIALAYLLVWSWQEHRKAAELLGQPPAREIIFLIDEIEAHLHPQWQRRIVPALLDVMDALTGEDDIPVQLIAATHSPLVLASVEPHFDEARDALFELELEGDRVALHHRPWAKHGDAASWLVSDTFGLGQARSIDAEIAIKAANAWMRDDRDALPTGLQTKEAIHDELKRVLGDLDPFWPRWIVTALQPEAATES
ncbi:MAG: AAA family ATPase [Acidobacteriota bacterium]